MKLEKKERDTIHGIVEDIKNCGKSKCFTILDIECHITKLDHKNDLYDIACRIRFGTNTIVQNNVPVSKIETELVRMVEEMINKLTWGINISTTTKNEIDVEFENLVFNRCPFKTPCKNGCSCLDCIHYYFLKNDLTEVEITDSEGLEMLKSNKAIVLEELDLDVVYNIKNFIKQECKCDFKNTIYKISGKTINKCYNIDDGKGIYTDETIFTCIILNDPSSNKEIMRTIEVLFGYNILCNDTALNNVEKIETNY